MLFAELREDLVEYLKIHQLEKKWERKKSLFENDFKHKSLNTELLEPRWRGIYSFRIDSKYRALFFFLDDQNIEVIAITNHYRR